MRAAIVVLLLLIAGGLGAAPRPGDVRVQRGLVFARPGGVALTGDLYAPAGPGRHPALVAVHGGGWQAADASLYRHWGPFLARRGYVVFAINYRLSRPGRPEYPGMVQDVRMALQFLRRGGAGLGVDPDRVGLMGDSAGAHLAALVALAGNRPPFVDGGSNVTPAGDDLPAKVCVAFYGIYDLAAQWRFDQTRHPDENLVEGFLGTTPAVDPARYAEASPRTHVAKEASPTAFFLAWGAKDDVADPEAQSAAFAGALSRAGLPVETVVLPDAGHYWATEPITPGSPAARLLPRLLRFLRRNL